MKKQSGVYVFEQEEIDDIVDLYCNQCKSMSAIARIYNVDSSVIKRQLLSKGIEITSNNRYKSRKVNQNFFEVIDTEEKAYWLGFIYADGCVSKTSNQDRFEIKLKRTDLDHVEKLKKSLQSEHKICFGVTDNEFGKCEYCSLNIVNQKLVDDLVSKGVFYNKSNILEPPNSSQLPLELVHHFIRGYFDGDGSVYEYSKTHEGTVSFVGTQSLLSWILENIKSCTDTKANLHKYADKDIYELKIGGSINFKNIYNFLYKDAITFLTRKKEKYETILNYRQTFNDYNNPSDCILNVKDEGIV